MYPKTDSGSIESMWVCDWKLQQSGCGLVYKNLLLLPKSKLDNALIISSIIWL